MLDKIQEEILCVQCVVYTREEKCVRKNAFCMVFHARWISHHLSQNPSLVASKCLE